MPTTNCRVRRLGHEQFSVEVTGCPTITMNISTSAVFGEIRRVVQQVIAKSQDSKAFTPTTTEIICLMVFAANQERVQLSPPTTPSSSLSISWDMPNPNTIVSFVNGSSTQFVCHVHYTTRTIKVTVSNPGGAGVERLNVSEILTQLTREIGGNPPRLHLIQQMSMIYWLVCLNGGGSGGEFGTPNIKELRVSLG